MIGVLSSLLIAAAPVDGLPPTPCHYTCDWDRKAQEVFDNACLGDKDPRSCKGGPVPNMVKEYVGGIQTYCPAGYNAEEIDQLTLWNGRHYRGYVCWRWRVAKWKPTGQHWTPDYLHDDDRRDAPWSRQWGHFWGHKP